MGFIYKITNLKNGKLYIGKTIKAIEKRFFEHIKSSKNPKTNLHFAFRKYGIENFKIEVIEEVDSDKLNEKEKFYIEKFNTIKDGYNMTPGGDGGPTRTGHKNTQEQKDKSSKAQKGKPKKNPGMCGKYEKSDLHKQKISDAIKGKIWVKNEELQVQKQIKPEEFDDYSKDGFIRGRLKSTSKKVSKALKGSEKCKTASNKKWVTDLKNKQIKLVKIDELETHLKNGWVLGIKLKNKQRNYK